MKKQVYAVSMLSAAMFLAACDGKDGINGTDGMDGADGFNSLIAIRDIPKGDAVCLGGGRAVDSGLDTNRNNVLDPSEVTATEIVECAATPTIRALHASPDAPAVNIWVDGTPALTDVDYTMGSGFLPVAEENNIQVEAIIPGVATEDRIVIDADLAFDYSTETTVIATRNLANNGGVPFPLVITNPSDERITQGYFRAQVVHAAPSAPEVDVYVTTPGADLAGSAPVNGVDNPLQFEEFTEERIEAPADTYQIRITPDNDTDTIFFDSGPLPLPAGADLMIVAVENQGPGNTPVQLVVLDGTTASMLYDTNTPASVVAAHLSPDAPAVDILADVTATPEVEAITLVENVSFLEFCDISVPAPGEYTINVALNEGGAIAYTFDPLSFEKGDEALAIVSGFALGGDPVLTDITLPGNTRSVLTETKLRITHSSPSTPAVNIKIVERGAGFGGEAVALFEGVEFTGDTTQLSVPVGNYDAYVALPGAAEPAIAVEGLLDFAGGEVLDVIAVDGEGGPELLVLDYSDEGNVAACPAPAL